jgi:hypothetical protein
LSKHFTYPLNNINVTNTITLIITIIAVKSKGVNGLTGYGVETVAFWLNGVGICGNDTVVLIFTCSVMLSNTPAVFSAYVVRNNVCGANDIAFGFMVHRSDSVIFAGFMLVGLGLGDIDCEHIKLFIKLSCCVVNVVAKVAFPV